ncbi:hypothetical protein JCM11641_002564 [Rhodosporidiobolus odoratus]
MTYPFYRLECYLETQLDPHVARYQIRHHLELAPFPLDHRLLPSPAHVYVTLLADAGSSHPVDCINVPLTLHINSPQLPEILANDPSPYTPNLDPLMHQMCTIQDVSEEVAPPPGPGHPHLRVFKPAFEILRVLIQVDAHRRNNPRNWPVQPDIPPDLYNVKRLIHLQFDSRIPIHLAPDDFIGIAKHVKKDVPIRLEKLVVYIARVTGTRSFAMFDAARNPHLAAEDVCRHWVLDLAYVGSMLRKPDMFNPHVDGYGCGQHSLGHHRRTAKRRAGWANLSEEEDGW